jgi:DNA phosphorothioation-dependent restriction protein DptG
MANMDCPQTFNPAILEFLNEVRVLPRCSDAGDAQLARMMDFPISGA